MVLKLLFVPGLLKSIKIIYLELINWNRTLKEYVHVLTVPSVLLLGRFVFGCNNLFTQFLSMGLDMIHCKLKYRLKMTEPLHTFSTRSQRVCVLNLARLRVHALVKLISRSHFKTILHNKRTKQSRLCISVGSVYFPKQVSPKDNPVPYKKWQTKSRATLNPVCAVCL